MNKQQVFNIILMFKKIINLHIFLLVLNNRFMKEMCATITERFVSYLCFFYKKAVPSIGIAYWLRLFSYY